MRLCKLTISCRAPLRLQSCCLRTAHRPSVRRKLSLTASSKMCWINKSQRLSKTMRAFAVLQISVKVSLPSWKSENLCGAESETAFAAHRGGDHNAYLIFFRAGTAH